MNDIYIRERISSLRTKKRISEYKMSLDLGHSKSYMQSISSGKSLPSLTEFLYICDYLGVSPKEFFDTDVEEPLLIKKLVTLAKDLSEEDLQALIHITERLQTKKNN